MSKYEKSVKKGKKQTQEAITIPGIVSKVFNKQVSVLTDKDTILCPLSNSLMREKDSCIVGDRVMLELIGPGQYQITEVMPRKTSVYRGNRRSIGEDILIAANPTMVIAVVPADYLLHQVGFAEQAVLAARRAGIPAVIYVSRCDTVSEDALTQVHKRMEWYQETADACIAGSNRKVPEEMLTLVRSQTVLLIGDRDSGKTSLMHGLLQAIDGAAAPAYVRQSTSSAVLMAAGDGTMFIDTPGFRDFALNHVSEEERLTVFPEIGRQAALCGFRSCTHQYEENCAVIEAVRKGDVSRERLSAYHQLGDEISKPAKIKADRPRHQETTGPMVEDAYGNVHADYRNNACLETFTCQNCGATVVPEGAGSKHRNHCPSCLCSVHVDNEPGDRASLCHGTMDPIAVWVRKGGEWALIHKCRLCGELSSNRVAADDNPLLLMSVAIKPLANPPFPLAELARAVPTGSESMKAENIEE